MTTPAQVVGHRGRLARTGWWLLGAIVVETAVGVALGASATPGYELVVLAYPLTALLVWRTVGHLPVRALFTGCPRRWVLLAAGLALGVQGAVLLFPAITGALVRGEPVPVVTTVVSVVVVAGFFTALPEELVFRGALLRGLTAAGGWAAALVITSVLFALAHLPRVLSQGERIDPLYLAGLVVFAASLAVLARSTGSLWPAVAWHAASNAGALLLEGTGLAPAGPGWLTDGTWSGGLLGLTTSLAGAVVVLLLARAVRADRRRDVDRPLHA